MADKDPDERVDIFKGGNMKKTGGEESYHYGKKLKGVSKAKPQDYKVPEPPPAADVSGGAMPSKMHSDPLPQREFTKSKKESGGPFGKIYKGFSKKSGGFTGKSAYTPAAPAKAASKSGPKYPRSDPTVHGKEPLLQSKSDRQYKSAASAPIFVLNEVRARHQQELDDTQGDESEDHPSSNHHKKARPLGKAKDVGYGECIFILEFSGI